MKTRTLTSKFEISKSFEKLSSAFLAQKLMQINPFIEYVTINMVTCSEVKIKIDKGQVIMWIERVGLAGNFHSVYTPVTFYWKYKNGELPLYPHEEVEEKDIQFWIEILDEFADRIRERFKSKPEPTLIEGYSFRVEMWKWDGVDAIFEITTPETYFNQIADIIENASAVWNELFEKGKKRHPIHYVGTAEKLDANHCEIHVDTGYAGMSALKHIFKYLHKAQIPIEKIEF